MQWRWARAHDSIDITGEGGALATRKSGRWYKSAVCGEVLQAEGEAYAEFTWVGSSPMVGVARAGADPSSVEGGLYATANGWMYHCGGGKHYHNFSGRVTPWTSGGSHGIKEGETVGLLLRRGCLSVHIEGRQVGVMCTALGGELVWAADLYRDGSSLRIARKEPPA